MEQIRPSDGRRTKVAPLRLNFFNFQPGEHVIFDAFGGWAHGVIDKINGNTVVIGNEHFEVTKVRARVPEGADAGQIVKELRAADDALNADLRRARDNHHDAKEAVFARHGVKHPGDE